VGQSPPVDPVVAGEELGCEAAAFRDDGLEEVERLDRGRLGQRCFGDGDDPPDARRDEDALPQSVVARSQGPPQVEQDVGEVGAALGEPCFHGRVPLFEEREQKVSDPHVVVVVIAARLLCGTQNPLGRGTEATEHGQAFSVWSERQGLDRHGGQTLI
jgi:hypothetical protein